MINYQPSPSFVLVHESHLCSKTRKWVPPRAMLGNHKRAAISSPPCYDSVKQPLSMLASFRDVWVYTCTLVPRFYAFALVAMRVGLHGLNVAHTYIYTVYI